MRFLFEDEGVLTELDEDQNIVRKTVKTGNHQLTGYHSAADLVSREIEVLKRGKNIVGLPRFIDRVDDCCFDMSYCEGVSLRESRLINQEQIDRLREIYNSLQSLGIFRVGHSQDDFLLTDESISMIDFGNVIFAEEGAFRCSLVKLWTKVRLFDLERRFLEI